MRGELAGKLRERLAFEMRDGERDAAGAPGSGWRPVTVAWTMVERLGRGAGAEEADARHAAGRWRLTLRRADGAAIRPGMRARWGERLLMVSADDHDPARPEIARFVAEDARG